MEVSANGFWRHLAAFIPIIAKSKFVVIDLEMTGIEPRGVGRLQTPTMEELYQRAKEATRTYRVLQLGITCIVYDESEDELKTISHNYHVSPMFNDHWDRAAETLARLVDRSLAISYSTLMFLKKNCVRIEDAYIDGVHYLSRAEEAEITPKLLSLGSAQNREDVDLVHADEETNEFYAFVVNRIKRWEGDPESFGSGFLNISNPHGGRLNRFQQRLIYQILDNEFPGRYRGVVRFNDFMQICLMDDEVETKASLVIGLRYLIEALVGGDFASDVAKLSASDNGDANKATDDLLASCEQTLKVKRPILVGHNMFLDLCFLYATFFAPLPNTLEEFGKAIHGLFPRIIDTKYIATQDEHDMMPAKNLDDLYKDAKIDQYKCVPCTFSPREDPTQNGKHHAGNDSFMTAVVFLTEMGNRLQDAPDSGEKVSPSKLTEQLFQWDSELFQAFANMVRVGRAGILSLE